MLHDELLVRRRITRLARRRSTDTVAQRHIWTVAYFAGASTTPALGQRWMGPDPALGGLRLWEKGLSMTPALSGATAPQGPVCIGITASATRGEQTL